jgi:hypothetical protein
LIFKVLVHHQKEEEEEEEVGLFFFCDRSSVAMGEHSKAKTSDVMVAALENEKVE